MNPSDFWKNFRLGDEIHISGAYIYNGLRQFHEMEILDYDDELFEFLYGLSVGFERLLKIAVVLHEHSIGINQTELENSLITHNHLDLVKRLRKNAIIKLERPHNDFLNLLSKFYKTMRYDRFTIGSVFEGRKELRQIQVLFEKYLHADFSNDESLFGTKNTDQYKKFIRNITLAIARNIYEIIKSRAKQINLYTYELRYMSKAGSVFLRELNMSDEDVLWKELLIFFMNSAAKTGYLNFLREIDPLDFDPALINDYLECFKSNSSKARVMDELEHHYRELNRKERKNRLECMDVIGKAILFEDEIDDEPELGN